MIPYMVCILNRITRTWNSVVFHVILNVSGCFVITLYIMTYPKKVSWKELFNFSFWLENLTKICLFWCASRRRLVGGAWSRTRQQNVNKKKVKIKSWITSFGNIILGKLLYEKWSGKTHKQSIFNENKLPFKSKLSYYAK